MRTMKKKPTHGGKRPGSGRKPTLGPTKMVNVRLSLATIERIEAKGNTVSAAIREAMKKAGY